jgi:hypothetical protein
MKLPTLILFTVLPVTAAAAPQYRNLVEEKREIVINGKEDVSFRCIPGTDSDFKVNSIAEIDVRRLMLINSPKIQMPRPPSEGCAEMEQEFQRQLPAKLVLRRQVHEQIARINTDAGEKCAKILFEETVGSLGSFLFSSHSYFKLQELESGSCR